MKATIIALTGITLTLGLAQAQEQAPEGAHGRGRAKLLEKFDTNNDGTIDESERQAARQSMRAKVLERFDADKDGKLNETERAAAKDAWQEMKDKHPGLGRFMRHRGHGHCPDKGDNAEGDAQ